MTDHQQAAIEAAAQQHSPHLWDGRFRDSLLRFRGFTPEIADEAVEKRRAEILAEAQEYIAAAEPHLRKKWAEELVRRVDASDLGAPLRIDPDGTFRMANGPEMRALLCEFVMEGAGE